MSLKRLIDKQVEKRLERALGVRPADAAATIIKSIDPASGGVMGPEGPRGPQGVKGDPGPPGKSLHTGLGPPSESIGREDDSYLDVNTGTLYGKK